MEHARGLMAFYADIAPEAVEDYRRWHNCEHMLERVSIPGFRRGRRYAGHPGAPGFLMMYETADAAVLGSAAYRAAASTRVRRPWNQRRAPDLVPAIAGATFTLPGGVRGRGPPGVARAQRSFTLRYNLVRTRARRAGPAARSARTRAWQARSPRGPRRR